MKALDLYEPVFQYVTYLNRHARNGVPFAFAQVRGEILTRLAAVEKRAEEDAALRDHVRELKAPMNYFIDHMIAQNQSLPFAQRWLKECLGFREDGLAGDEAFFDYLNEALRQPPSQPLAERLLVYYTCLGLGFEGFFFSKPEKLKEYMRSLTPAVRQWLVEDTVDHLVPQAYQYTDRRSFTRPPRVRKALILAGVLALLLAGIPLYVWIARDLVEQVSQQEHMREINESAQTPWKSEPEK